MSGHLQVRVNRPVLDLILHNDAVQALLHVLFPRTTPAQPEPEMDIDWEDGEPHGERDAEAAR